MRPLLRLARLTLVPVAARQQPTVFRAGTQTVPVFTTVLGPDGRLVTDLIKDDFEVYDDGRPQPITVFANENQPISIVVMLDTSGSMTGNLGLLKDASVQLFTHLCLPTRRASATSATELRSVLDSPTIRTSSFAGCGRISQAGGPTPLWGAVNVGMTALEHVDGRRVVLVFTDGYDASSREFVTLRDVMSRAQSDGFMIYGVGLWSRSGHWSRPGSMMQTMPPDPGLRSLADETGGGYFELLDTENLGPTFARVAEELHRQYLLGFSAPRLDGKVHKLDVHVRQASMTARARKSYVAQSGEKRPS